MRAEYTFNTQIYINIQVYIGFPHYFNPCFTLNFVKPIKICSIKSSIVKISSSENQARLPIHEQMIIITNGPKSNTNPRPKCRFKEGRNQQPQNLAKFITSEKASFYFFSKFNTPTPSNFVIVL